VDLGGIGGEGIPEKGVKEVILLRAGKHQGAEMNPNHPALLNSSKGETVEGKGPYSMQVFFEGALKNEGLLFGRRLSACPQKARWRGGIKEG